MAEKRVLVKATSKSFQFLGHCFLMRMQTRDFPQRDDNGNLRVPDSEAVCGGVLFQWRRGLGLLLLFWCFGPDLASSCGSAALYYFESGNVTDNPVPQALGSRIDQWFERFLVSFVVHSKLVRIEND